MDIEITGASGVEDAMDAALQQLLSKIDAAVQGAGIDCQAGAKQACPVDTGRLRASIQYAKTGEAACQVGTDVEYAMPVEMGHVTQSGSFVAARPYLFPAFISASKNLLDELKGL